MTADEKKAPQETAPLDLPEPAPKRPQWTLLLVSDAGRIVKVRRVRGWVTLLAAMPLLAAAIVAGGYFGSDRSPDEDRRLTAAAERLGQELQGLRVENARLAAVKSDAAETGVSPEPPPEDGDARPAGTLPPGWTDEDGDAPAHAGRPASSGEDESPAAPGADAAALTPGADPQEEAEGASPAADEEAPDGPVAVSDLTLDYNTDRSSVSAEFKIVNRRADGEALYGFAFVILKADENSPAQWLVFPETELTPQGPASFRKGYDFSISNFMRIRFNPRPLPAGTVFHVATVHVYDASGRLLAAKDFQLN